MAARGLFSLLSLVLVAAGVLFAMFILLAGAVDGNPVNRWYFLQVDTSNIPGAPSLSRWTFWNICDGSSGRNDCSGSGYGDVSPARPFDPPSKHNFGTDVNIPDQFIKHHDYYYLMTRCMFAFALMSLFFGVVALFTGLLALCTRLGAYFSAVMTTLAWIFQCICAALMTTAYVKGRDHFRGNGQGARIGAYAFGFEWAAFCCWFLATILFCVGGGSKREKTYTSTKKRGGFFGKRNNSTRSRGSFIKADKEYSAS